VVMSRPIISRSTPRRPAARNTPMIFLVHQTFALGPPFGEHIRGFAKDLAGRG
jgi:hypothetical protein